MALIGAACLLGAPPAQADGVKDALGSDAANAENFWTLVTKGVHFDFSGGLWVANLSGGLTSLTNSASQIGYGATATDKALDSVGTGHGLVRELRFGLQVRGNEAYFDYLSDKLFQTATEELDRHVDDPLLRETLLKIAGELRPDLKSILGDESKVWLRAEYGRFEGLIRNGHLFGSKNGKPFFGRRAEPWDTTYFGLEAGWYPEGRDADTEFNARKRDRERGPMGVRGGDEGVGIYAKMREFTRPVVVGFSPEPDVANFVLTDGEILAVELGVRVDLLSCGDIFCARASGYMAPFTGVTHVAYAGIGDGLGGLVSIGGDLRVSIPINVADVFAFGPYGGFRVDYLLPFVSSSTDSANDSSEFNEALEPWALDYFFWGPTFGLMGQL